jgi:hypothetical protein
MVEIAPVAAHVPVVKLSPRWTTILASPLLYAMIMPLVLVDIFLELYHRIAFPILGIPTVRRKQYIKIDRHLLPYLPAILKVACAYCGYANGLLQYAARIAGETERYFCPIKHQAGADFHPPPHHRDFTEYGDAAGFRRRWEAGEGRKDQEALSQPGP